MSEKIIVNETVTEIIEIKDAPENIVIVSKAIEFIEVAKQGPPGIAGSGEIIIKAGVGGVLKGRVGFITTNETIQHANAYEPTHQGRVIGVVMENGLAGEYVRVRNIGEIEDSGWNLEAGKVYYLVAGGEINQTPPTSGFIQRIGVPKNSQVLNIILGEPVKII